MSKQPLYTAIGWVTWTVGKRVLRRRLAAALPSRKVLALGVASVAVAGVAATLTSGSSGND